MKKKVLSGINLDGRVVITILASSVASGLLLLYSFKSNNYDACFAGRISYKAGVHYTGESIRFIAEGPGAASKSKSWRFGASLVGIKIGTAVYHTFTTPGRHMVRLTIDGMCIKDTVIDITPALRRPDLIPKFRVPRTAFVGVPVIFKDSTPGATQWEWRFGETASVDDTSRNPKYTFRSTGLKTITLVVNGNMHGRQKVSVGTKVASIDPYHLPSYYQGSAKIPDGPSVETLRVPDSDTGKTLIILPPLPEARIALPAPITEVHIEKLLRKVVDGHGQLNDFDVYLLNKDIPVYYNGTTTTFPDLFATLKRIKRSNRIREMVVSREIDPATNRMRSLTIDVDKKWLHKIINN